LRTVFLGDEAVHRSRALGLLGVIDRSDLDAGLVLERREDGFGEDLVLRDVDHDHLRIVARIERPQQQETRDEHHRYDEK